MIVILIFLGLRVKVYDCRMFRCFPSPLNPPISNFIVFVEWLDDLPDDTAADMTADIDDFLVLVMVMVVVVVVGVVVATEPLRLRADVKSVRFSTDAVARTVVNDNERFRG